MALDHRVYSLPFQQHQSIANVIEVHQVDAATRAIQDAIDKKPAISLSFRGKDLNQSFDVIPVSTCSFSCD